ncbi:hypothetical protein BD414DRAFT_115290 [Trametes punicea]|nr:hypothetical protein BD414DRAFT_115290 [Trametes punicea]
MEPRARPEAEVLNSDLTISRPLRSVAMYGWCISGPIASRCPPQVEKESENLCCCLFGSSTSDRNRVRGSHARNSTGILWLEGWMKDLPLEAGTLSFLIRACVHLLARPRCNADANADTGHDTLLVRWPSARCSRGVDVTEFARSVPLPGDCDPCLRALDFSEHVGYCVAILARFMNARTAYRIRFTTTTTLLLACQPISSARHRSMSQSLSLPLSPDPDLIWQMSLGDHQVASPLPAVIMSGQGRTRTQALLQMDHDGQCSQLGGRVPPHRLRLKLGIATVVLFSANASFARAFASRGRCSRLLPLMRIQCLIVRDRARGAPPFAGGSASESC